MTETTQPYTVEWIQLAAAFVGTAISAFALSQAMLDLFAVVTLRRNGINGLVAFARVRREIFQSVVHGLLLISGGYLIVIRFSGELPPTAVPAVLGLLYIRSLTMTAISVILLVNTLFDRAERYIVRTLDVTYGRRIGDTPDKEHVHG